MANEPSGEAVAARCAARQAELDRVVRALVEGCEPACILLHGLFAGSKMDDSSTIELCVIKESDQGFKERSAEVGRLAWSREIDQTVVYTPAEFERAARQAPWFIAADFLQPGRVLYVKDEERARWLAGLREEVDARR